MKAIPKRTLLVTCVIILLPMFFGLALWNRLPERMPTHFDFSGTADDYSGRPFAVIGLPLFILAMQLFCAVMLRADPKKQNINKQAAANSQLNLIYLGLRCFSQLSKILFFNAVFSAKASRTWLNLSRQTFSLANIKVSASSG